MIRYYILPLNVVGKKRHAKYLSNSAEVTPLITSQYSMRYYGLNNVCLASVDVTNAEHTLLSAQIDVLAFPEDIEQNLTQSAINNATPQLEAFNIPTDWITTSLTYKRVLRRIVRMFNVFVRLHRMHSEKIFDEGFSLDSEFSTFSAATKDNLRNIAAEFNIDLTGQSGTTKAREIIQLLMTAQNGQDAGFRGL